MSDFESPVIQFTESEDGITYHLCDLPMHIHWIPIQFENCYELGCVTWESKYAF